MKMSRPSKEISISWLCPLKFLIQKINSNIGTKIFQLNRLLCMSYSTQTLDQLGFKRGASELWRVKRLFDLKTLSECWLGAKCSSIFSPLLGPVFNNIRMGPGLAALRRGWAILSGHWATFCGLTNAKHSQGTRPHCLEKRLGHLIRSLSHFLWVN